MSTPKWRIYLTAVKGQTDPVLGDRIRLNIQTMREQRGWSRPELGKRCKPPTSGQQIERLEKGQRGLDVEWIERIARGFGVDPATLIAGGEEGFTLTAPVADELAERFARIALQGAEPDPVTVQVLSILIQELSATFSAHPQARRDPDVVRPVIDLLTRKPFEQSA